MSTPGQIAQVEPRTDLSLDRIHDVRSSLRASVLKDSSIRNTSAILAEYIGQYDPGSLAGLIGAFLRWEGKPYTLDRHFQFEPILSTSIAPNMVFMTGRQLGKTVAESVEAILRCATLIEPRPYSHMFVTPLFEQVRRISNDHIRPLLENSPLRTAWMGRLSERSVLRRIFKNGAKMIFTFAYTSADRIRGNSVDGVTFDEVQDFREEFFPIVNEVVAASPYQILRYYGTAKGSDTTLARLWGDTSQAEWVIPCIRCGYYNIPSLDYDILNMLGPLRDDISPENPALVCAKCRKPVHPKLGRWLHRHQDLSTKFPGYHLPQPIMETHYGSRKNWEILLDKQAGRRSFTPTQFNNEVLGEPVGAGIELISLGEIQASACLGFKNQIEDPPYERLRGNTEYRASVIAADWGGGGEDGNSRTVLAAGGINHAHFIDIVWGKMLPNPHDHIGEADECLRHFKGFKPTRFAHDFTGAGTMRESMITTAGFPVDRLTPYEYVRSSRQKIVLKVPPKRGMPRRYWKLDKARGMLMTIAGIKQGRVRFFEDDYRSREDRGLLRHFLALTERKGEMSDYHLNPVYSIGRKPGASDDFAQAVMMVCVTLWSMYNCWPVSDMAERHRLTTHQEKAMQGQFEDNDMEGEIHDDD